MLIHLMALRTLLYALLQGEQKVAPDLANEVAVTGAAGAWGEGSYAEVVASTSSTKKTILKGIEVVTITGLHQLTLATGSAGNEVDATTLPVSAVGFYPVSADIIPESTRIAAKTASKAGGSQAVAIKLIYSEA